MRYTTPEQSKKLIEVGVDPKSADMFYERFSLNDVVDSRLIHMGKSPVVVHNLFSYRKGYVIPAWSTDALWEMLPKKIEEHDHPFYVQVSPQFKGIDSAEDYNYCVSYESSRYDKKSESIFEAYGVTLIEALYNLILMLYETNYLPVKEEKA